MIELDDISDYYQVAPRYGTNEDVKGLFEEADRRGLRILFDCVASYTSIDHPWFQASAEQKKNPYSNWYIWTDNVWLDPPKAYFLNIAAKRFEQLAGDSMQISCDERNYTLDMPGVSYAIYRLD